MLIDFPKEKEKVKKFYTDVIKIKKDLLSPTALASRVRVFEGHKHLLVREDGTYEESEYSPIGEEIKFDIKEIENMAQANTLDPLYKKFDELAEKIASKEAKMFYGKIDQTLEKTGGIVSAKGRPFFEVFFECIEKIEIDFDENGKPEFPTLIINPETEEKIKLQDKLKEIETDQSYNKRFKEILDKKREDFRDRENSRKLVG